MFKNFKKKKIYRKKQYNRDIYIINYVYKFNKKKY